MREVGETEVTVEPDLDDDVEDHSDNVLDIDEDDLLEFVLDEIFMELDVEFSLGGAPGVGNTPGGTLVTGEGGDDWIEVRIVVVDDTSVDEKEGDRVGVEPEEGEFVI